MSNLKDCAAYLRGLADGMGLNKEKNENRLLLEMLNLMDEMADKITELDEDMGEMEAYVEDLDSDLADMEDVLFGDEDEECDCCDCDDDDCDCDCDCDEEEHEEFEALSFECPNCGKDVVLMASDIDYDKSPICAHCGTPFFTDMPDEDEDGEEE